jgi:DNA-binding beta-propeller fold protein YncE
MNCFFKVITMCATLLASATTTQAKIWHRDTIENLRVVSLAYDAEICGVWMVDESSEIVLLSTFGVERDRFDSGMASVRSLTVEAGGLLIADGWGRFQRLTRSGRPIEEPFSLSQTLMDSEGLHRDADGSFLVVEDDPSRLLRIAPDGEVLMELFGDDFNPPMIEPQGVTRDPSSGNILVVDDNEGLNSLFELAPDGRVLTVIPLSEYGRDAEGVALQPETGRLFVGFDGGRALAIFDWIPSEITVDTPLERGPDCAIS